MLTLPLTEEHANELLAKPSDERRQALTELWASDAVKDAEVDKIRCNFSLDSTRSAPIPEEGPVTPYTPETASHASVADSAGMDWHEGSAVQGTSTTLGSFGRADREPQRSPASREEHTAGGARGKE